MQRILFIDDGAELCRSLAACLETEGFAVRAVRDMEEALRQALSGDFDLAVLDTVAPFRVGLQLLQGIRRSSDLPLLMLTQQGADQERVLALEMGADDSLSKPLLPRELVARIRAILRRTRPDVSRPPAAGTPRRTVVGDVEVHSGTRVAYRQGKQVGLTSIEFNVLEVLLREAGRIVSREDIAREALGRDLGINDRSVDVHISNLRRKLGRHRNGIERIRTVRNRGYLFAPLD